MVVPNFDIRWINRCRSASEVDVFSGSLKEVVDDFEGSLGVCTPAADNSLGISTGAGSGDAVEIAEEGIDDSDVRHAFEGYAPRSFVLGSSVHPDSIKHKMISGPSLLHEGQSGYGGPRLAARYLQSDEPVMIGSVHKSQWTGTAFIVKFKFGQDVVQWLGALFKEHYYLLLEAIIAGLVLWLAIRRQKKRKILIAEKGRDSRKVT